MAYTVKQLADLAHISVRTLHFYDEMGLLKPAEVKSNGYRMYGEKELLTLQQILFFRELEFSLEQIKEIISAPGFDVAEALEYQKKLLNLKKKRLQGLITTIDNTLTHMATQQPIDDKDLYGSLSREEIDAYKAEAKERWGSTKAYKQSMERTSKWSKADWAKFKEEQAILMAQLGEAMDKGATSAEFQALIPLHKRSIEQFYDFDAQFYKNLADMYIQDPRFTATYDKVKPGLAQVLRDGIHHYCDTVLMKQK